ncbi:MAG TPA: UDP-N-acetylmuramate--L-alanine ligase [Gemmatimonas aurantiaca]|uniref:UDP-N-acetylmuramate--L-alanine ligase n=2 Tax=Gemmatimonas aurantiaca TaxID=173480 RepID=C1A8B1_GEMAT|nr:UDP-N-acetylmuramate--L-alanine ligase [Gemmatimonas aurantiaca]BAH38471.1 UDP-N-acetylmuramate--L-alanine ligase [Gemmatimonas aurantiaca T-27]HCT56202.1 UDP-N-acetylmuramate--L-alanine ligase [Gemmatimonas aurantiaca]
MTGHETGLPSETTGATAPDGDAHDIGTPASRRVVLATDDPRPVHFVGIAGAGMSALAELLVRRGVAVQGTDANPTGAPDLDALGVTVSPHDDTLVSRARALVYSSAIPATHPEMAAARAAGIPIIRRAEALADAVSGGTLIGVSGTHGKTTTTVMTTEALASAGRHPTGVVGGRVESWEGNLRLGGDTYVVEADEYDRSFLALDPTVAVVLNVEADHLDIYRDLDDITRTFEVYVSKAKTLVRCADDEGAMSLRVASSREIIAYSATVPGTLPAPRAVDARLLAADLVLDAAGSRFMVVFDGERLGEISLAVPGLHNVRNALAAIGSGLALGCTVAQMAPGLAGFRGVQRRFQRLGSAAGVEVVDDYAHHPTEVRATLAAARHAFPGRRIVLAFQPHLYSRTRDLQQEFADALRETDVLYLCDIYGARETPEPGVTSSLVADRIPGDVVRWQGPRTDVVPALLQGVAEGDVVLTMGAGDITKAGPALLDALRSTGRSSESR